MHIQRINVEIERLSDSKNQSEHYSQSEIDDEPSEFSSVQQKYDSNKLKELEPNLNVVMEGSATHHKLFDKYEFNMFEKLLKRLKYKYEDVMKILELYTEVVPFILYSNSASLELTKLILWSVAFLVGTQS